MIPILDWRFKCRLIEYMNCLYEPAARGLPWARVGTLSPGPSATNDMLTSQ